MRINRALVWHSMQVLFMSIGGVGSAAFIATLQWWLMIIAVIALITTGVLIYKIEIGLVAQRNFSQFLEREGR